jgi:hypothetical protein
MTRHLAILALLSACQPLQDIHCVHTCVADGVSATATICGGEEARSKCAAPEWGGAELGQTVLVQSSAPAQDDATVVHIDNDHEFWISGELRTFDLGGGVYSEDSELLGIIEDGDDRWRFVVKP